MFNVQGSEVIIILLLALVVLGPEKLPDAMRKMGQFYAELRKMSSGFQEEFRSAVDEPMRELRNTADALRDSADFTKLQSGERDEKPKSADMAPVGDPTPEPVDDVPTFDTPTAEAAATRDSADGADDAKPVPFGGNSSAAPRPAAARPKHDAADDDRTATGDASTDDPGAAMLREAPPRPAAGAVDDGADEGGTGDDDSDDDSDDGSDDGSGRDDEATRTTP